MSIDTSQAPMSRDDVLTIRWDRITTRDDDGTTWVLCVTDTGRPVALRLDEEHAEALAGALLDTPDGGQAAAGQVARVRALHACETHYHLVTIWDPYDRGHSGDACDHCDTPIRDLAGELTSNHFEDEHETLRCRVRPRRTCTVCFTAQEEEVLWPCDTITALDGEDTEAAQQPTDAVLAIVAEWCTESWETGGIDADDLAWRLQEAGYPLPKDGA